MRSAAQRLAVAGFDWATAPPALPMRLLELIG
jgi:hypothetical protein